MKDNLDVHQFKNESSVKVNYINRAATRNLASTKITLCSVMATLSLVGGFVWIAASTIDKNNYEQVAHLRDTYENGRVQHNHELDFESFVGDFKIVNPGGDEEDIYKAIEKGEYEHYTRHAGEIKIDKNLQGEPLENDDVRDFTEQFFASRGGKGSK